MRSRAAPGRAAARRAYALARGEQVDAEVLAYPLETGSGNRNRERDGAAHRIEESGTECRDALGMLFVVDCDTRAPACFDLLEEIGWPRDRVRRQLRQRGAHKQPLPFIRSLHPQ